MNSEQFKDAIRSTGLVPPDHIVPGVLYRFPGLDKSKSNTAGRCKMFNDGVGGWFQDLASGIEGNWQAARKASYSQAEREAFMRQLAEDRRANEAEEAAKHEEGAIQAAEIWGKATLATAEHPYLLKKRIKAHGVRLSSGPLYPGALVIPMRDADGKLWSVQFIKANGDKRFLSGGKVTGCYFAIGTTKGATAGCTGEGFATCATCHEASNHPIAVAFDAGNLGVVTQTLRAKLPDLPIIVCGDDDYFKPGNPGVTKATAAAHAVNGRLALPSFGPDRVASDTDFNDMARLSGLDAVRAALDAAKPVADAEPQAETAEPPQADLAALLAVLDESEQATAAKIQSAFSAITPNSTLVGSKHTASKIVGLALCTEYGAAHRALGRALCATWDATTAGCSLPVFETADPNYQGMTGPLGIPTLFKLAAAAGWKFEEADKADGVWPEPQAMITRIDPEPYPIDALPDTLRAAVDEVHAFVKSPLSMVIAAALSALSLSIQQHVDVKRDEKLTGPTGLFLLTIAESGERKSTVDGFFTTAVRAYEKNQAELAKPVIRKYLAASDAWEAKKAGIKDKIRQLAKEGKPTESTEKALYILEDERPEKPRVPKIMHEDITPQELARVLAKDWPSGGVVSAEGGIVFGSHGMGKDSAVLNLATLNKLWDGGTVMIGRKTSDSFTVDGVRLTMAIQVQEQTIRSFFKQTGDLARGTGFMARFLISWPDSTQGYRPFTSAPKDWPALAVFNKRVSALLNIPAPIDENGELHPVMMDLSPDAKALWVEFHDAIEAELASGGDLHQVRDVASKTADNAVRLAALFQVFERGVTGHIEADYFDRAASIAAWHLNESRRFLSEFVLPDELAASMRLDAWLIEYCRINQTLEVSKRDAQRLGPIRDGAMFDYAVKDMVDLDRIRIIKVGKKIAIHLNPALLEVR